MKTNEIELVNTINVIEIEDSNNLETFYNKNKITESDLQKLVIFKKSAKYITYLNLFFKRLIDIIGSLVGIILLIPLTIVVATVNLFNKDNGPIFYIHKRLGKNGQHFYMYKFRTMVNNSQEVLEKLLKEDKDARITKFGKFLRKTSLDEMPQFINVLKGEMSLVGPRAVVDDEIEKFGLYKDKVLSVKPGITGYWAAHGRSNTSYDDRVQMENYYVENNSVFLDIKILFDTVISVMKKEGAV